MPQVYLQRIEISNFRAFGDNFSFSPPGPGVTLLMDPEGPGKGAFFEAIEWALTGRVLRLEAFTPKSLDRRRNNGLLARRAEDVPVAQYRVSLEFVNGEGKSTRIERRAVREQENHEQFAEGSSPTQQQLMDLLRAGSWVKDIGDTGEYLRPTHLGQAVEQAATALMERKRLLSQAEETLNAWQSSDSTAAAAIQLQTVLEVDERRRAAELKRDTLLRLSAARRKIAQGVPQKSSTAARIDRHTHEMWMIQPHLRDTARRIQRIHELDSQIRSLLLVKQEIDSCQQAYDEWCKEDEVLRSKEPGRSAGSTEQASHRARQEAIQSSLMLTGVAWGQIPSHLAESSRRTQLELEAAQAARTQLPDLEYLHDYEAGLRVRTAQLASAITQEHKVVAQIEEELLAAHALLQQHPELLSALGTLPSDEANAIDEAVRAVAQLVHHERQLVQSEEPFPSVLARLTEELAKAQAPSAHEASEAQSLEQRVASLRQRWLELGLQGFPSPVSVDEQRNKLADQESELQRLREQQKRLADAGSSMSMACWRSRWPVLLLEGPLQQHDLIQAAAFIEVLGGLVRDRKYQVFLSIHDEALADSMRRKMEEAGIECVTCR